MVSIRFGIDGSKTISGSTTFGKGPRRNFILLEIDGSNLALGSSAFGAVNKLGRIGEPSNFALKIGLSALSLFASISNSFLYHPNH